MFRQLKALGWGEEMFILLAFLAIFQQIIRLFPLCYLSILPTLQFMSLLPSLPFNKPHRTTINFFHLWLMQQMLGRRFLMNHSLRILVSSILILLWWQHFKILFHQFYTTVLHLETYLTGLKNTHCIIISGCFKWWCKMVVLEKTDLC